MTISIADRPRSGLVMSNKSILRLEDLEERLAPSATSLDLDAPAPLLHLRRVVQDSVLTSPTPDVRLTRVIRNSVISNPDAKHHDTAGGVQLDAKFKPTFFQKIGGGTSPVTVLQYQHMKMIFND
jgi:hypothetical protein